MENQPLDYEDFYTHLWGSISAKIVSESYIEQNKDFIDSVTFDYYRIYEMSENISISVVRRMVESFFFNLFRYKPTLNNS